MENTSLFYHLGPVSMTPSVCQLFCILLSVIGDANKIIWI